MSRINSREKKQYMLKFTVVIFTLILSGVMLSGCDLGAFAVFEDEEEEELRGQLPEWEVLDLVEAYYNSILAEDIPDDMTRTELMKSTLHPEQDVEVSRNFEEENFYGENLESNYSLSRDEYVKGYEDYFYTDISEIDIVNVIRFNVGDGTAEYIARVDKEVSNNDEDDLDDFSYKLTLDVEQYHSQWYISSIRKEDPDTD